MEYIIVLLIAIAIAIIFLVVGFSGSRRAGPGSSPASGGVGPDRPAAEEPTPARSATASENQAEKAQKRTPPA